MEGERLLSTEDGFHSGHMVSDISAYSHFEVASGLVTGVMEAVHRPGWKA